jgi:hypothetical protein
VFLIVRSFDLLLQDCNRLAAVTTEEFENSEERLQLVCELASLPEVYDIVMNLMLLEFQSNNPVSRETVEGKNNENRDGNVRGVFTKERKEEIGAGIDNQGRIYDKIEIPISLEEAQDDKRGIESMFRELQIQLEKTFPQSSV